jgi:hypothetical protein
MGRRAGAGPGGGGGGLELALPDEAEHMFGDPDAETLDASAQETAAGGWWEEAYYGGEGPGTDRTGDAIDYTTSMASGSGGSFGGGGGGGGGGLSTDAARFVSYNSLHEDSGAFAPLSTASAAETAGGGYAMSETAAVVDMGGAGAHLGSPPSRGADQLPEPVE